MADLSWFFNNQLLVMGLGFLFFIALLLRDQLRERFFQGTGTKGMYRPKNLWINGVQIIKWVEQEVAEVDVQDDDGKVRPHPLMKVMITDSSGEEREINPRDLEGVNSDSYVGKKKSPRSFHIINRESTGYLKQIDVLQRALITEEADKNKLYKSKEKVILDMAETIGDVVKKTTPFFPKKDDDGKGSGGKIIMPLQGGDGS